MRGSHLLTLLAIVVLLFMLLAGIALVGFIRASNYGVQLNQINETGKLMPDLFRE